VVVEYELTGTEGKHFKRAVDRCLQDEQEVAVFSVDRLVPLAVWRHFDGKWNRTQLNEPFTSKKIS
jgi:hypothetical protein